MEPAEDKSLFEISLTSEGASNILRVYKFASIIFFVVLFISFFNNIHAWLRYLKYSDIKTKGNALLIFEIKIYPYFSTIFNILVIIQNSVYYYFYRSWKKSIELREPESFNRSLRWLLLSVKLATAGVIIELAVSLFYIYYDM